MVQLRQSKAMCSTVDPRWSSARARLDWSGAEQSDVCAEARQCGQRVLRAVGRDQQRHGRHAVVWVFGDPREALGGRSTLSLRRRWAAAANTKSNVSPSQFAVATAPLGTAADYTDGATYSVATYHIGPQPCAAVLRDGVQAEHSRARHGTGTAQARHRHGTGSQATVTRRSRR